MTTVRSTLAQVNIDPAAVGGGHEVKAAELLSSDELGCIVHKIGFGEVTQQGLVTVVPAVVQTDHVKIRGQQRGQVFEEPMILCPTRQQY